MLCPNCGAEVGDSIQLCGRCEKLKRFKDSQEEIEGVIEGAESGGGEDGEEAEQSAENQVDSSEASPPEIDEKPAGFWRRVIAYLFDAGCTVVLTHVVQQLIFSLLGFSFAEISYLLSRPEQILGALAAGLVGGLVLSFASYLLIHLLYYALFESSERQATPGKIIIGLRVTDLYGKRLSFSHAALRHIASALSIVTFGIGFVMAGFGERKQALHDRISGCVVTVSKLRTTPELVAAGLCAFVFYLVCLKITESEEGKVDQGQPLSSLPGVIVAPPPPQPVVRRDGGLLTFDDKVESLKSTRVLWSAEDNLLEVRFYPAELADIQDADYRATVLIGVRADASAFDKNSITACFIRILIDGKEMELPCDGLLKDAVSAQAKINYLTGDVTSVEPLVGSFEGSLEMINPSTNSSRSLRWLLEFNAPLRNRNEYDHENRILSERNFSKTLALLDRTQRRLTIGYFADDLVDEDIRAIREENSLDVVKDNPAIAHGIVMLSENATKISEDSVVSCAVSFPELAGSSAIEVTADVGQCSKEGVLNEGEHLRGELIGKYPVSTEAFSGLLSWKLPFDAPVVDVDVAGKDSPLSVENPARGYVKVGAEVVEFQSAVALYFAKAGRVDIGFYALPLTPADRAAIVRNRSFFTSVRDRVANLILSIRFAPDTASADINKIIETSIYFVRDTFGGFYFPGNYDRQSVARSKTQLLSGELRRFSGALKTDELLEGLLKGESAIAAVGQTFSWKADFKVPIAVVD